MLFRSLAAAIWNTSLRPFAPYDQRPSATRARPRGGGRDDQAPPRSSRGKLFALTGLALAAVVVVAATVVVEAQFAGGRRPAGGNSTGLLGSGSGVPSASTPVSATATSASSQPKSWTQVGPAYAQRAAFSESAPSRIYACGYQNADPNAQTGPISLAVSRDAGATWQTLATPAKGAYCDVRVSTSTPQNVALFASALCGQDGCSSTDPNQLDLSTDGGAHWSAAQLPATSGTPATPTYTFAWAGATLFAEAGIAGQTGGHYLAASANGGAFAWVDQNITGLPTGAGPIAGELRAIGATVYVTFSGGCANTQTGCPIIARTSDGGATWTHVAPTYVGKAYTNVGGIRLVAGAPGAPLIGAAEGCQCAAAPLLRSTDGGATWTELPGYPSAYHAREFWTVETPDGTVYATLEQDYGGPIGVYALAPGASAWRLIAYPAGDQYWALAGATWDAVGHPAALWGWSWSNSAAEGVWRLTP